MSDLSDSSAVGEVNPLSVQVGGGHYTHLAIQPFEHYEQTGRAVCLPRAGVYVMRFRDKGGAEDLRKALYCVEVWLQLKSQGRAAERVVVSSLVALETCRLNGYDVEQSAALLALESDHFGKNWPLAFRSAVEQLLVAEYGAESGE